MAFRTPIALMVVTSFLFASCGDQDALRENADIVRTQSGIMGGEAVAKNDPAQASIVQIENMMSGFVCTGTLIDSNIVLTAAHCVNEEDAQFLRLDFGLERRPVTNWVKHKLFFDDPTQKIRPDFALLKFAGSLPEGKQTARFATLNEKVQIGSRFLAIGFGRTNGRFRDPNAPDDFGVLRKVDLEVFRWHVSDLQFIADQSGGKGVCLGDSGGPALTWDKSGRPVILGVASAVFFLESTPKTELSDDCHGVSLYIDVTAYKEWLDQARTQLNNEESL